MPIVLPFAELGVFVIVLWVIAMCLIIAVIMGFISGALGGLPFPLNKLSGPVKSLSQGITSACFKAIQKAEQLLGASFHMLARYMDKLWHELRSGAIGLLEAATILGLLVHIVRTIRGLVHGVGHVLHSFRTALHGLERKFHGIEHRVKVLERDIAKGIGHDLRIHIKALERWKKAAKAQLSRDEQAITQTIPAELGKIEDWIGMEAGQTKTQWEIAIGTAILAALGLGGLNCNSNPFKNNKNACGLWGDLGDILGLLAATLAVLDFEQLVREMQTLEEVTVTGLHDVLNMV